MAVSKKLTLVCGLVAGLLLLLTGAALTSPVQTWVARRVLAAHPEMKAELDRVQVGWGHVTVENLRVAYAGAYLTLPKLDVDLPVQKAVFSRRIAISRLIARDWTLDLTEYKAANPVAGLGTAPAFSLLSSAYAADVPPPTNSVFQGIISQLQLPIDVALDGAIMEGTVKLRLGRNPVPASVRVSLLGGGLQEGHEAAFVLNARLELAGDEAPVKALQIGGSFTAIMDSPRTFSKVAGKLTASATGSAFPQGVQLNTEISAARVSGGEDYALSVQSVGKRLLDIQANYPENSTRFGGIWHLDMRDTDVAPFLLGYTLPSFEAIGAGMFETDNLFSEIHAAGRIKSTADRLDALMPTLADVGAVTLFGEFNLTQRDRITRLDKLVLDLKRPGTVFGIQSLQPFEFNFASGELKVADPNAELLAISTEGLPVVWARPFIQVVQLGAGRVNGRVVASARDGGVSLHTVEPLQIDDLSVGLDRETQFEAMAVTLNLTADYNPSGWQAVISDLRINQAGENLLTLELKTGQLPGEDQPVKATGKMVVALGPVSRAPLVRDSLALERGTFTAEFSASLGGTQEYQGRVQVTDLVNPAGAALPSLEGNLRASLNPEGKVVFNLPLVVTKTTPARSSDLTMSGSMFAEHPGYRIEATLAAGRVYLEDMEMYASLAAAPTGLGDPDQTVTDTKPFWDGLSGVLNLALKKLYYNDQFEMNDVGGAIHIEAGSLKLNGVKAGVGQGGDIKLEGAVDYKVKAPDPYALKAEVLVQEFDTGPLFRALDPNNPPRVDGLFNLSSKLAASGRNPAELLARTTGDLQVSSSGGVFRILAADYTNKVENAGKIAAVGAFLGNVAGVLGKNKGAGFTSKAQAVAELSKLLTAIQYDQLSLWLTHDQDLNTILKDFSLIAPEVRLTGSGQFAGGNNLGILEQPMALAFTMKARGHTGDVLKYLNVLSAQNDELGYANCELPLRVDGTLLQPNTSELQGSLVKLAVEHSGAGDLLNRLLGK
ncbi:MAG: AsmA family protein [Cephaloticoccus sp.]|nr:AsmA family protein [Cephaloticoccus sp.]